MLKSSLSSVSRYLLWVNDYRSSDLMLSKVLRSVSADIKILGQRFCTGNAALSTATNNDRLNEADDVKEKPVKSTPSSQPKRFPCPDKAKLLQVALIGKPNAGKSTLINALMNIEVCPASMRPHTTRKPQRAIYLEEDTQIIFIDTPGVVNQKEIHKFNFSREFALGPRKSIKSADVIAVMHDVSNRLMRNKLDKKITTLLDNYPEKPAVLILNKVDLIVSKRKLLDVLALLTEGMIAGKPIPIHVEKKKDPKSGVLNTEHILEKAAQAKRLKEIAAVSDACTTRPGTPVISHLPVEEEENEHEIHNSSKINSEGEDEDPDVRGWPNFQEVFMMSSLTGEGLDSFKDYVIKQAKLADWAYPEEVLTDYSPKDLTLLTLKSKILDHCEHEVPYKVTLSLDIWEETDSGNLVIGIGIRCATSRVQKILIGQKGSTISSITHETERSLMKLLRRNVNLHITATCPEEKAPDRSNHEITKFKPS